MSENVSKKLLTFSIPYMHYDHLVRLETTLDAISLISSMPGAKAKNDAPMPRMINPIMVSTKFTMIDTRAPAPAFLALFGLLLCHAMKRIIPTKGRKNPSIAHPMLPLSRAAGSSS